MCDLNLRISFLIPVLFVVMSPKVANISNTSKISVAIENIFEKNSKDFKKSLKSKV